MLLDPEVVYGFTTSVLASRFDEPKPTPEFHRDLWTYMCDDASHVAAAAPRGHAKSTAVTHSFVLACICFKVKKHVMLVSDTESQAIDFLNTIKLEFRENEMLKELFGFKRFIKDRESEIVGEFLDGSKFRIIAKGSGQKVRGTTWRNTRPDLVVGDDLENDEIVMNDDRRYKFRSWMLNALLPCGSRTCHYRIVGTILHLDSFLERLMPKLNAPDTIVEDLKQYSTNKDRAWLSVRYKAHNEDFTKVLWKEQYDKKRLTAIRASYVEQGHPEGYSQEYLNYPIDETNAMFRKKDFLPLQEDPGPLEYYISGDLAVSERKQRAYSVFCVAALTSDNVLRYEKVIRFRGDSLEIIDYLFELVRMFTPELVIIEKENIASSLLPIIKKAMEERGVYFNLDMPVPSKDKIQRARPLQARMRAGKVQFDVEADWFPDFQAEFLHFPRGVYRDQVDAAAWVPFRLNALASVPTPREMAEALYEDEIENSFSFYDDGRNEITGY